MYMLLKCAEVGGGQDEMMKQKLTKGGYFPLYERVKSGSRVLMIVSISLEVPFMVSQEL